MARRPSEVEPAVVEALNDGRRETANLAESLAIDFARLLAAVGRAGVAVRPADLEAVRAAAGLGVTRRMRLAAERLLDANGPGVVDALARHPADTVRGWACLAVGLLEGPGLEERLAAVRPLAEDHHFGVREWACLGVRDHVAADPRRAIAELAGWTGGAEGARRFASEATRPRGVWVAHIAALKAEPSLGLPVLEPLRADPSRYVQDSVANWLNDAAKTRAVWVAEVTARWEAESPGPETARICKRARRGMGRT